MDYTKKIGKDGEDYEFAYIRDEFDELPDGKYTIVIKDRTK